MKESDLIFGLMAAIEKDEYSIADFRHLLAPFQVSESSLRTALSRMSQKGVIKSSRRGRNSYYRFDRKGLRIKTNVLSSFKSLDWSAWDRRWWGIIFSVPETRKENRYKIRKKLSSYRFVPLCPGFWIRPFNELEKLTEGLSSILENDHCRAIVFQYLEEVTADLVAKLWKLEQLNREFKRGLTILNRKRDLDRLSPREALRERMLTGDEIVNILFKDPLLPPLFLPEDWKAEELRSAFYAWDERLRDLSKPYWEMIF